MSSPTITPVETSPITKLTATTAISMMFIGSRSCCAATAHTDGGFSLLISFGPYFDSRAAASAPVRPESASDPSPATTSAASRAYGGSVPASAAADVISASPRGGHDGLDRMRPDRGTTDGRERSGA